MEEGSSDHHVMARKPAVYQSISMRRREQGVLAMMPIENIRRYIEWPSIQVSNLSKLGPNARNQKQVRTSTIPTAFRQAIKPGE